MNIYKGRIPSIKNVDIDCTFTGSLHEMRVFFCRSDIVFFIEILII